MRLGVIYKISINNKFLIGSSINPVTRKASHLSLLKRNVHSNTILQNAYNKYGEDSFKFEIVQKDIPENILLYLEDIWIAASRSRFNCKNNGMNIRDASRLNYSQETKDKISKANKGKILSEETKNKISDSCKKIIKTKEWIEKVRISHIGKKRNTDNWFNSKKVYQYDLEGNFIKEWKTITEATLFYAKKLSANIVSCCKLNQKSAYGFQWRYEKEEKISKIKPQAKSKKVMQKDMFGNTVKIWDSTRSAKNFGFSQSRISECCNGNITVYKGFKWEFV